MGIIQPSTPPTPGDLIIREMNTAFLYNLGVYNRNMTRLWSNPDFTPQQVCDQLGTNAAAAFQLAGGLAALLNAAQPGTIDTSTVPAFTVNDDGTVTIPSSGS